MRLDQVGAVDGRVVRRAARDEQHLPGAGGEPSRLFRAGQQRVDRGAQRGGLLQDLRVHVADRARGSRR